MVLQQHDELPPNASQMYDEEKFFLCTEREILAGPSCYENKYLVTNS